MARKPKELTELQKATKDVELHLNEVQKRNAKEVTDEQLKRAAILSRKERAGWLRKQKGKGKEE